MKKKVLIGVFSAFLLVAGCSINEESKKEEVKQEQKQESKIKQNKELTKQVKDEEGVIDGQVYEQDGMAIGTLVLDKKVSNKDAKKLAEKYAEELKAEYKDLKVNVQAVRDGKNVANITKE
jgi:flagellar biosynthesis component FlhA